MMKRSECPAAPVAVRIVLTAVLAVVLALAGVPVAAFAEEGEEAGIAAVEGNVDEWSAMEITPEPDAKEILAENVTAPAPQVFSGFPLIPEPIVRDGDEVLREGTDYEVRYVNNTNVGTATIYITGEWHYTGEVSVTFEIAPRNIAEAKAEVFGQQLTVTFNGLTLVEGRDYTVERSGDVGTITGIGNFEGSLATSMPSYSTFLDVTAATPHSNEVLWLAGQKISEGWPVNGGREFRPYNNIVRADMAAFLFRLARNWGIVDESWQPSGSISFIDVTSQTAHYREVMWLAESKISEGWPVAGGREFRPYSDIVRADMAAFICRLAKLAGKYDWAKPAGQGFFCDVNGTTAHVNEVLWLAGSKISTGWGSGSTREFWPYATAIRADMAAFLYRLDKLTKSAGEDEIEDPGEEPTTPTTPTDPTEPTTPTEDRVLITKTGTKYHRLSGCRSTAGKAVTEISLAEALSRGLEPCKNCYH